MTIHAAREALDELSNIEAVVTQDIDPNDYEAFNRRVEQVVQIYAAQIIADAIRERLSS